MSGRIPGLTTIGFQSRLLEGGISALKMFTATVDTVSRLLPASSARYARHCARQDLQSSPEVSCVLKKAWLIPLIDGTKSIATGISRATLVASWRAPDGRTCQFPGAISSAPASSAPRKPAFIVSASSPRSSPKSTVRKCTRKPTTFIRLASHFLAAMSASGKAGRITPF